MAWTERGLAAAPKSPVLPDAPAVAVDPNEPADCTIETRDAVLDGVDLASVTAVATLAGAAISPAQAVALAARMARSLGVRVHDPGGDGSGFPPSP